MSFHVTTKDIEQNLEPLGFDVEIWGRWEDDDILRITHPDHKGVTLQAVVLNDDGLLDELTRKVEGDSVLDFGENLNGDSISSMEEFVKLVQARIIPATTP